jgi:hypothetical protein
MGRDGEVIDLRSGDLILYSGQHPIHRWQQKRTGCRWAQVGLVLRLPGEMETVVFEATKLSRAHDVRTGTIVQGVQVVHLSERVASFDGPVAFRRLSPPLSNDLETRLLLFADQMHGRPFNENKWMAFRAFSRRNATSREPGFFCSELVAEAYQQIGLLPKPPEGLGSNNYIPADFSSCYTARVLPLQSGFQLVDEQLGVPVRSALSANRLE